MGRGDYWSQAHATIGCRDILCSCPTVQADQQERLTLAVRDNRARVWQDRLPTLLAREIAPMSFRRSAEVADVEQLVAERQRDFRTVSRRRWTTDLKTEALTTLRRFSTVDRPVVLLSVEPQEFFAVALPDAAFLQKPDALVDVVGCFAVVAEHENSGLLFEWGWTDAREGDWGELATWGDFTRLSL
ncbi:MAG: hypothetical protein ABW060_01550 [Solirubrobacteraceae bacterium]